MGPKVNEFEKPFTIITKWLDVVVEWSLENANWMFLVTKKDGDGGKITFDYAKPEDCNETQIVNWIFYAEDGWHADLKLLREENPELLTFEDWLKTTEIHEK